MGVNFIYMTAADKAEARKIARELVSKGLAACVNIFDNVNAFYKWDGALQDDVQIVMVAKTTENRVSELIEKVKALHSDDCPCVVSLPTSGGYQPFLDWVVEELN
jgi:periplasmic divalent cation tolerance protein